MKEYIIKVATVVDDYYNIRANSLDQAMEKVIDLVFNSDDIDIINSKSYVKDISCVDYEEEDDYYE